MQQVFYKMTPGKYTSYVILALAVFFLSTSGIFAKVAQAPSGIIAFYRLLVAAVALLPLLLCKRENREQLANLPRKQLYTGVLSGFILAVHYVLWFESLKFTSVASSVVLVTLQPLFTILGSYLLWRESCSKGAMVGCLLAIAGSIVIGWGDFSISWRAFLGDGMALLAAAVIAGYFLIGQQVRRSLGVIPYSVLGYSSGAFFLGLYSLACGDAFTGYTTQTWLCFLGLALVSTILGQLIFNWLLKWLSATVISMSILGETVGTCFLGYVLLGEVVTLQQLIGILGILCGIGIFLYQKDR